MRCGRISLWLSQSTANDFHVETNLSVAADLIPQCAKLGNDTHYYERGEENIHYGVFALVLLS